METIISLNYHRIINKVNCFRLVLSFRLTENAKNFNEKILNKKCCVCRVCGCVCVCVCILQIQICVYMLLGIVQATDDRLII